MKSKSALSDLYTLPNIGPRSVALLGSVGVKTIKQLQKLGPEKVYDKLCLSQKSHIHMAFLYVLRAAYSYSNEKVDFDGAKKWWLFRSPKDKDLVVYYKQKFNNKLKKVKK